jgi:hypothetical protein
MSSQRCPAFHDSHWFREALTNGTQALPAFYNFKPNGELAWVNRNPDHKKFALPALGLPSSGLINTALITNDTVYLGALFDSCPGSAATLAGCTGKPAKSE